MNPPPSRTLLAAVLAAASGCAKLSGVDELTFGRSKGTDAGASDAADEPDAAEAADAADAAETGPLPVPFFGELQERCKLINGTSVKDPTANDTHHRANLGGSSLGIAVAHADQLYLFFGDTEGANGIWPRPAASLPDAVGYSDVPYSSVAQDPSLLCTNLRFLLSGNKTGDVEGDFAGATMQPPAGHSISEFIHNPAGPYQSKLHPDMPGNIEVPSGAFSYGGSIYVFYTIANTYPKEVRGSYLAKWDAPSTGGKPEYRILYHVDQRFDGNGPLRGDFINIAALVEGDYLYLFGTGEFRASPVHLARKLLSTLETEGGFESYDAATSSWVAAGAPADPIVATPNIGELSVQHFPAIGRYVMLDQESSLGNRIAARFAEKPEGPWSEAVTVATMTDPAFDEKYCCDDQECLGEQLLHCDQGGFFGTYLLPDVIVGPDASFTITFTMSIWEPYNVALMSATFR